MVSTDCLGVIEAVCNPSTTAIGSLLIIMELTCGQFDANNYPLPGRCQLKLPV